MIKAIPKTDDYTAMVSYLFTQLACIRWAPSSKDAS
jgi:hypothetical protein